MMKPTRPTRPPARRAFTLVELLVVLLIIVVLASLTTAGAVKIFGYQQARTTEQTVVKLEQAFQKQWRAVIDTAKTEQPNQMAVALSNNDDRRARVIHILMCLRREFPTSFAEATFPGPSGFGPNPTYVRALQNYTQANNWGGRNAEHQSSACLYLALKQRRRGSDFDPDTGLAPQELIDPANDGVKEIVDAWGEPVVFNRWPTPSTGYGGQVLNPGGPQLFNGSAPADTEDPEGLLTSPTPTPALPMPWQTWLVTNSLLPTFTTFVGYPLAAPNANGQPQQYALTPVIMSKGGDAKTPSKDDIYNFQLSSLGGQR